ncbi:MAG: hypothetical protein F4Y69_00615 [Chloroflexi bacterium]|nr:hypothetical protein [Chloroflexota bacterium]MYF21156.1 hypothetical protein [Chloroflexota bacterium]
MALGGGIGGAGDPMMDPAEMAKLIPKPRRMMWKQEKLVDEAYLQYRDRTEELPEPDLVERIFLIIMQGDRCLLVRHGDRHQPWVLPILEFEIEPRPEPLDPEMDQAARRASLTQTIGAVVEDTWQVPVGNWSQHTQVQMTAKELQDKVEPGSRRYEMIVTAEAGEPNDLRDDSEWARRFFPSREVVKLLRERYNDYEELELAYDQMLIEAAKTGV